MNRLKIICDDKFVSVDGVGYNNLTFTIDPAIHAVQWYGSYGEVEFSSKFDPDTKTLSKPSNEIIDDIVPFADAIEAWKAADEAAAAAKLKDQEAPYSPPA